VSEDKKPPPKDAGEYSAFKQLLDKIAKVPREEIEEQEQKYQEEQDRTSMRRKRAAR
jgi:hypothetical protein